MKNIHYPLTKKAFSLVEIIIVIAVLGALVMLLVPRFTKSIEKNKDAEAKNILWSIYMSQETHFLDTGRYAMEFPSLDIEFGHSNIEKYDFNSLFFELDDNYDVWKKPTVETDIPITAANDTAGSVYIGSITRRQGYILRIDNKGKFCCCNRPSGEFKCTGNDPICTGVDARCE